MSTYLLVEGSPTLVALAPGGHHDAAARLEHARHLFDVPLLVGHVLAALASPHKVETVVREVHGQGVHHAELGVGDVLLLRESSSALSLVARESDAHHTGAFTESFS